MAFSMKDIKNRIKSVENTRQITKAMELVAVSKLRRARETVEKTRPYFEALEQTISEIEGTLREGTTVFSEKREKKKACFVVIGGDRGLAGGYNQNVLKMAEEKAAEFEEVTVMPVGRKIEEFFSRRGYNLMSTKYIVAESVNIPDCLDIAKPICEGFADGKYDEVILFYTDFTSLMTQKAESQSVLPFETKGGGAKSGLTIYEPSASAALRSIVPLYISGMIYGALCESRASEYAARQTAMNSANKNADEMISDLQLKYNRVRQTAITQEITEIVAGAQE
ncbi:MAG: ATP synthase F1 subunit gamma [Clostridia bacterium]|nr:ATP synthase F1 subunit gamma [Clostridia bacterium]